MMRIPPGAVLLDPADVDYLARALEEFVTAMAPRSPSPRLQATIGKLRRAARDSLDALTLSEPAIDVGQRPEPSAQPSDTRAPQQDSMHAGGHDDIGTGDAARALRVTPGAVRDLARRGRLPARHTGTRWVYPAAAVDTLAAERRAARQGR